MKRSLWRRSTSTAVDSWLFVRAWVSLVRVDHDLRTRGFHDVVQQLESKALPEGTSIDTRELRRARRYARRIDDAARFHVVRARCLHRSLVLHTWLRNEELPSELRIGVRKSDEHLGAHAWVEMDRFVVNDRRDTVAGFAVILSLSAYHVPNDVVWSRQ